MVLVDEFEERADDDEILQVRIVAGLPRHYDGIPLNVRSLAHGERRFTLEMTGGGGCGIGYEVIVGSMAGTWVIKEYRPIWIS